MNKNRTLLKLIAGLAAFAVLAGLLIIYVVRFMPVSKRMSAGDYFGSLEENEAAVIAEDHLAEGRAVRMEDRWFIDYALVQSELNPRFYWDESAGLMLFTTASEIYEIPADSSAYLTGEGTQDAGYTVIKTTENGKYVDLEFLREHSDFTYEIYEDPGRIVISRGSRTVTSAVVKKNSAVRYLGGIKSLVLTEAQKGSEVVILEQMEHWSQIRTADGYIGYIKNSSLTEISEQTRPSVYTGPEYTSLSMEDRVNLVWHQIDYAQMNDNFAEDTAQMSGVNVISPTWYFLSDNEGNIDSLADASYVKQAHEAGLQVWALISNFSADVSTAELLASRAARQKVQDYLIAQAEEIGFDGINIDFEGIPETAGYSYVQFMRELSILCRERGLYLSVDVPVPMDFSSHYDRKELGVVCDYVIMMGYDEHYAGSDIVGSVASMDFERNGIENMLSEVPGEKIVSAIPFYTRLWYTRTLEDGTVSVTSEALGMGSAWDVVEQNGVAAVWDDDAGQPYAEWTNAEGVFCQIWLEDDSTVAERASMVSEYDLGGIAAWVLGREKDYVWQVISENIR
ncbi:MAG: glycosyl hydrolase family 18 protein [Lachnospiraceae bacterium]|nr:glycosyl hydrolase family 18 protein [Lachnospiraceae bacterium]